jgi:hypothetical protein
MPANVPGLCEGGDFYHKISYEAPNFKFTKNCHTKHYTATFAKPVLQAGVLVYMIKKPLILGVQRSIIIC